MRFPEPWRLPLTVIVVPLETLMPAPGLIVVVPENDELPRKLVFWPFAAAGIPYVKVPLIAIGLEIVKALAVPKLPPEKFN